MSQINQKIQKSRPAPHDSPEFRRGKIVPLKEVVDEAIEICEERGHEIEKVIVVNIGRMNL